MVTDGIDAYEGGPNDPYIDTTVDELQRNQVIVYSMYARAAGHYGHSYWRMMWGQNDLARISDESGGEMYYLGYQTPVSFQPYLEDVATKLDHQYLLKFLARAENKAGFQPVKVQTEVPNAELVSADRVYVPAGK